MKTEEIRKELREGFVEKMESDLESTFITGQSDTSTRLPNDEIQDLVDTFAPIQLQMSHEVQVQQEPPKSLNILRSQMVKDILCCCCDYLESLDQNARYVDGWF